MIVQGVWAVAPWMCDITWCGEYFITDIHQIKVVKLVHQLTATDKVICEQKERTSNSSRDFGKGFMLHDAHSSNFYRRQNLSHISCWSSTYSLSW